MFRGALVGVITGVLILPTVPAAANGGDVDTAVAQLPGLVREMMQRTGVPGVAVGVVHEDRLIYSQGFGVRSSEDSKQVNAKTVFQMASVSKPVGASAVAAAIGKGGLLWDDPVVKHLPRFRMKDPWVGKHATIGDFYAHRSGLPGGTGNDLEAFGISRDTIIKRIRHVPLAPFRASYSYSNFGMTVGGVAAAASRGQTWEDMNDTLLFKPLGMTSSSFRHADFVERSNRATLHQQVGSRWVPSQRQPDAQAPAGGLSSSVVDMAKWVRMQLSNGRFDGKRVVAKAPLQQARSLQMRTSAPDEDASRMRGYAFGIDVERDDTGQIRWSHSGAFAAGAATRVVMLPGYDVGLVVLTNGWPVGIPEALGESFVDLVETGTVSRDWLALIGPQFAQYTTATKTAFGQAKPQSPAPAKRLKTYAGDYRGKYLGRVKVRVEDGKLILTLGSVDLKLRHWTGNTFAYRAIDMPKGFTTGVRFRVKKGKSVAVKVQEVSDELGSLGVARR